MRKLRSSMWLVTLIGSAQPVCALNILDVPLVDQAPVIDGTISDQERANSASTTMTLAGGFEKPQNSTTVYCSGAAGALYVAFDCLDKAPAGIVTKVQKDNGPVFNDDSVELVVTPEQDASKSNYYHFAVNANGVKYSNYAGSDSAVEGWTAAAQKTPTGWQAEISVPYATVRSLEPQGFWRANASRFRPPRGNEQQERSAWVDFTSSIHNFKRFGYLKFKPMAFPEFQRLMLGDNPPPPGASRRPAPPPPAAAATTATTPTAPAP